MALLFRRSNALLLLVPKTGSSWIRAKVAELGLDVAEVGDPAMREHDLLQHFDRSGYSAVGAFVRDPIDWYRSYWAYRMERGWRPRYALDEHCRSEDFETFVRLAVSTLPGALGNIYTSYTGGPEDEIDFVGRQETLAADLARFLDLIGEPYDPAVLDTGGRVNATSTRPAYPEELKELITLSEWDTMARFGYLAARPDPFDLAGMRRRYPEHADDLRLLALWTEKIHWSPDDRKRAAGRPIRPQTRYARVHSNFALYAQHKLADPEYAEQRYRQALALDPNHPRTLCNYAMLQWERHADLTAARKLMLRALAGRPQHAYTLGKLAALTDRGLQDPALAEIFYRQSLAANQDQPQLRAEFADFLARHGKAEEAIELLRADADSAAADPLTLITFASLLARAGHDLAEAAEYQRRAAREPAPA
ncbi:MAG TPA: hypothetical protein VFU36_00285 [Jatrophihabitans sp.]|nr:hypothetical protein [Jatrophihabitans sp.]